MRQLGSFILLITLSACAAKSAQSGVAMGQFVSDEKINAVRVCETTRDQLVDSFGPPNGEGREGDMVTLQWMAAAGVSDSQKTTFATQQILAWIDKDGKVAQFLVNPTGLPSTPEPCSATQ